MAKAKEKPIESTETQEPQLNEDGLVAGQDVDFQTLNRILAEKRDAKTKEDDAV